jgi:threonine dehydrogenase-like Zn-dependent dehydrogenase
MGQRNLLSNAHNTLPPDLMTHRFAMTDIMKAYDTLGNAAKEGARKVRL